ncbi:MAG: molybdopterin synthase catalytic [Geobacteraceae bacterium]|nr:MAG: molybdopterin synthase catalytic [Geobacteraceae bacterium]
MVRISAEPINPSEAYGLLGKNGAGSVVFHYAVVKADTGAGKVTACIEYRADGDMEAELNRISTDIQEKWNVEDVLLIRRVGCLGPGDIISLVAASSPNSEDAFESCRYGIARLKKMASVSKNEVFL